MYSINARVCYKGLVLQGFPVIEARVCEDLYKSKALHHWAAITKKEFVAYSITKCHVI